MAAFSVFIDLSTSTGPLLYLYFFMY